MLDGHPKAEETKRLFDAWLATHYGLCRRCGGPRGAHLTRPYLRCEQGC